MWILIILLASVVYGVDSIYVYPGQYDGKVSKNGVGGVLDGAFYTGTGWEFVRDWEEGLYRDKNKRIRYDSRARVALGLWHLSSDSVIYFQNDLGEVETISVVGKLENGWSCIEGSYPEPSAVRMMREAGVSVLGLKLWNWERAVGPIRADTAYMEVSDTDTDIVFADTYEVIVGSDTFYLPARWSEAGLVEFLVLCDSVGFLLEKE